MSLNDPRPQTNDPHLDLFEQIMQGLAVHERERWVQRFMPRTYAMLTVGQMLPHTGARLSSGKRLGALADE